MNLGEFLACPKGMDLEEYDKLLNRKKKLEKKAYRISSEIDFELDALDVLENERGSVRWMKHAVRMKELKQELEKICNSIDDIKERIQ